MSESLESHGLQHARPSCPSPTPGVYSNSCLLSQWCPPTISSSVIPFSSCLQSFPASGSYQMSQFFSSGGQSIGVSASASILPMTVQDWSSLGWTGWISLQSKGLSRVFSNTTVWKCRFFGAQLRLIDSYITACNIYGYLCLLTVYWVILIIWDVDEIKKIKCLLFWGTHNNNVKDILNLLNSPRLNIK